MDRRPAGTIGLVGWAGGLGGAGRPAEPPAPQSAAGRAVGTLRELLGRDEDRHGLADVALAAGVTLVAVVVVGAATLAVLAFRPDTTPGVARALYDANSLLIAFASFPAAAFQLSASVVVLRSRVLPSWLGWAGLLVAAADVVGAASFGQEACSGPRATW